MCANYHGWYSNIIYRAYGNGKNTDEKVYHKTIFSMSALILFGFLTLMLLIFELSIFQLCRTIMLSTEFQ